MKFFPLTRPKDIAEGDSMVAYVIERIEQKRAELAQQDGNYPPIQRLGLEMMLCHYEWSTLETKLSKYKDYYAVVIGWDGDDDDHFQSTGIDVTWGQTAVNERETAERYVAEQNAAQVKQAIEPKKRLLLKQAVYTAWTVGFIGGIAVTVVCGVVAHRLNLF